jgi:GTP-binding protein HflX
VTSSARSVDAEQSLNELAGLADAAGATVVLRMLQERPKPDAATFIGSGKVAALGAAAAEADVDVVIFDNELTPAQLRQLEEKLERKVIDRTQLILDIFARRARTREGKWQVELAQLKYLLPRLAGSGTALSRLGGGIGTRGPGETKLETDRRRIRARIQAIQKEIDQVRQRRSHLRERRQKQAVPTVALVGYTNAGKTTLFNRLTNERAVASNALFVTLDPLVRQVRLPIDANCSSPTRSGSSTGCRTPSSRPFGLRWRRWPKPTSPFTSSMPRAPIAIGRSARRRVLDEVGATDVPIIDVYNKIDAISADERRRLQEADPAAALISAVTARASSELLQMIASRLALDTRRITITFDSDKEFDRQQIGRLYRVARVISHVATNGRVVIEADVPRRFIERLTSRVKPPMARSNRRGTVSASFNIAPRLVARGLWIVLTLLLAASCASKAPPAAPAAQNTRTSSTRPYRWTSPEPPARNGLNAAGVSCRPTA